MIKKWKCDLEKCNHKTNVKHLYCIYCTLGLTKEGRLNKKRRRKIANFIDWPIKYVKYEEELKRKDKLKELNNEK